MTPGVSDPEPVKTCPKCRSELPLEAFGRNSSSSNGLQSWCHQCKNAQQRERRARQRPAPPDRKRCSNCRRELPLEVFDRHNYWCGDCVRAYEAERAARPTKPELPLDQKRCAVCKQIKGRDEFGEHGYNRDGLRGACKACTAETDRERKREAAERAEPMRRCSVCQRAKQLSEMQQTPFGALGTATYCQACANKPRTPALARAAGVRWVMVPG